MDENKITDNMTDEAAVESNENEKTTIGIKTIMKHRNAFNQLPGTTNEEKYLNLLEAFNKQKTKDKRINIAGYKESILKSFANIENQLQAVESSVMEYQEELEDTYVNEFGIALDDLKSSIEDEELLKAKIVNLEKELEKANELTEKQSSAIVELTEKANDLEAKNTEYVALNTSLVNKENDYINQLREKDSTINSKDLEISNNKKLYDDEVTELKEEHKTKVQELKDKYETEINDYRNKISTIDKEKAVLENSVKSLNTSLSNSNDEIHELKEEIKKITKETKAEIRTIEQDYKNEIKILEDKAKALEIEKAKEEAKTGALEVTIDTLKSTITDLHSEKDELKGKLEDAEKVKLEQSINIKNLKEQLIKEISEYKALLVDRENKLKNMEQKNKELLEELNKLKSSKQE